MVTQIAADLFNPFDFMTKVTTNERSHGVTTHDISLLLSAYFQEWPHSDAVTMSVCVHKLDNNSGTSTPRAPQTLAEWKQSAWEQRDGDNYERERGEQREIRVYVRRNSWIMLELSVYLKMSRQSRPWVEGKYHSQEGPPVFPTPIALFWLVEDWKQPLELCVDLVTW